MYESRREYEARVAREVAVLEWALGRRVRHGEDGVCPRCGEEGCYDLLGLSFTAGDCNSIYYSTVFEEWRCRRCDYYLSA